MTITICSTFYPSLYADLLIGSLGAFLGIVGAYYLYRLSLKQVRKDRLTYITSLIENVIRSSRNQSDNCKTHREKILQEPLAIHYLQLLANSDTKRLADKVDQEGVYHAYLWKYGRPESSYKRFKELYGVIDYIDYLIDDLLKTNERILHNTWERKKEYQQRFKNITETIQAMLLIEQINNEQPELCQLCRKQLQRLGNAEGENLILSYEIVVRPIRDYITSKAKQHPKVTELLFLIDDANNQYYGLTLSAKHNAEDYLMYEEKLSLASDKLENLSKTLRNEFGKKQ
jgi:hypothetical protein